VTADAVEGWSRGSGSRMRRADEALEASGGLVVRAGRASIDMTFERLFELVRATRREQLTALIERELEPAPAPAHEHEHAHAHAPEPEPEPEPAIGHGGAGEVAS
jgi:hypothetical protein